MSRFQPLEAYASGQGDTYSLLPLRFTPFDAERYILTNLVGEYHLLPREALRAFLDHELPSETTLYGNLKAKHFLLDEDSNVTIDLLALKTRTKYKRLANFTSLHMFVVTLRCEHSCPY